MCKNHKWVSCVYHWATVDFYAVGMKQPMSILSVQDVSKTYRKWGQETIVALENVSLEVDSGQIFGLLGPNGAGKTTLIKCVLDLVRVDQGQITVMGVPATTPAARKRVGFLPEDQQLPEYLDAGQLLDFVGRLFELPASVRKQRTDQLLDQVGLSKRRHTKIHAYSKGMRQRLGIAQALINEPQVLILDEPNEGLDPLGRADIKALLQDLKGTGVTIFISSHVLAEIEHICDRVAILHEGKLLHEGPVQKLTQDKDLEQSFIELIRGAQTGETAEAA